MLWLIDYKSYVWLIENAHQSASRRSSSKTLSPSSQDTQRSPLVRKQATACRARWWIQPWQLVLDGGNLSQLGAACVSWGQLVFSWGMAFAWLRKVDKTKHIVYDVWFLPQSIEKSAPPPLSAESWWRRSRGSLWWRSPTWRARRGCCPTGSGQDSFFILHLFICFLLLVAPLDLTIKALNRIFFYHLIISIIK